MNSKSFAIILVFNNMSLPYSPSQANLLGTPNGSRILFKNTGYRVWTGTKHMETHPQFKWISICLCLWHMFDLTTIAVAKRIARKEKWKLNERSAKIESPGIVVIFEESADWALFPWFCNTWDLNVHVSKYIISANGAQRNLYANVFSRKPISPHSTHPHSWSLQAMVINGMLWARSKTREST